MGGSKAGWYNLAGIQWKDLGRKYIIKRGKNSQRPDFGSSVYHTADEIYNNEIDEPLKIILKADQSQMLRD